MSQRAARHELADRPVLGTPRPLPRMLMCHVPKGFNGRWCGRHWTANTMEQYASMLKIRTVHQELCGSLEDSHG